MSIPKILAYDDLPQERNRYVQILTTLSSVREAFAIEPITDDEIAASLTELEERQAASRKKQSRPRRRVRIDEADILIVDYDLFGASRTGASN